MTLIFKTQASAIYRWTLNSKSITVVQTCILHSDLYIIVIFILQGRLR